MADKTPPEYPLLPALKGNEVILVWSGGVMYRTTPNRLLKLINGDVSDEDAWGVKAWGSFNGRPGGAGAVMKLTGGKGVASVTKTATGKYNVVIKAAMPNVGYSVLANARGVGAGVAAMQIVSCVVVNARAFNITVVNPVTNAFADAQYISFTAIR